MAVLTVVQAVHQEGCTVVGEEEGEGEVICLTGMDQACLVIMKRIAPALISLGVLKV